MKKRLHKKMDRRRTLALSDWGGSLIVGWTHGNGALCRYMSPSGRGEVTGGGHQLVIRLDNGEKHKWHWVIFSSELKFSLSHSQAAALRWLSNYFIIEIFFWENQHESSFNDEWVITEQVAWKKRTRVCVQVERPLLAMGIMTPVHQVDLFLSCFCA